MKERQALFTGAMVNAILDGRKQITRRLIKPQPFWKQIPPSAPGGWWVKGRTKDVELQNWSDPVTFAAALGSHIGSPYGRTGDRLWVKEVWRPFIAHSHGQDACDCDDVSVTYAADGAQRHFSGRDVPSEWMMPKAARTGNVSPLIMPRWASRLTLEVVSVRAERLHDITEEDAQSEGVERHPTENGWRNYEPEPAFESVSYHLTARDSFASLWRSIYGAESWAANPWIFAISFRRVTP